MCIASVVPFGYMWQEALAHREHARRNAANPINPPVNNQPAAGNGTGVGEGATPWSVTVAVTPIVPSSVPFMTRSAGNTEEEFPASRDDLVPIKATGASLNVNEPPEPGCG